MSKLDLIDIIKEFPDNILENIIIAYLRELFFSGDWGTANAMIEYILSNNEFESLHGRIANFGVFIAVRAKDLQKALDRYNYLGKLNRTDSNICLLAGALLNLTDILLPDQPSLLADLWIKEIQSGLPVLAQEKYAKIGVMLYSQFNNNYDFQQSENIIKILETYLNKRIFGQCRKQINSLADKMK